MSRVYLDHNATSPPRPEVREAVARALDTVAGNPASMHAEGREARALLEGGRERVAALVGVPPGHLVLTSGGSEAIEAAVRGVCDRAPANIRRILVSAVEHSSVLEAVRAYARRGFEVDVIACDREGRVEPEAFRERLGLGRTTALVALQWANNETGVLQPVEEVGRLCRLAHVPFLVDAVQVAGKIAFDPRDAFADLVAVSAHKLGGPQGIGALGVREGFVLAPLIHGGAQEKRRRGGTPAVALVAGFGVAAEAALAGMKEESSRLLRLRARIETVLRDLFHDVRFHGQAAPRLPNTVNFSIPGAPGETLVIALDVAGFAVSTGSACASGAVEPSHVLRAMGIDDGESRAAVRVSTGWSTTRDDVERFLEALPRIVARVREAAADDGTGRRLDGPRRRR